MEHTLKVLTDFIDAGNDLADAINRDAAIIAETAKKRRVEIVEATPYSDVLDRINDVISLVLKSQNRVSSAIYEASLNLAKSRATLDAAGDRTKDDRKTVVLGFKEWEQLRRKANK